MLFMSTQDQIRIDNIYKNLSLEEIPWNIEIPPALLVELVASSKVRPGKAIDLGCGTGNYAIFLAAEGYKVTGVDFSPTAIEIAKKNSQRKNVTCDFIVADVVEQLGDFNQTWDFAYDWGLLHHIPPEQRSKYVRNVHHILNPDGKYLSVCFSERDVSFGSSGKYRKTPLGSILYFSSEDELRKLFELHFRIIDLQTVEIGGKFESHLFNYVFMDRKRD